MNLIKRLGKVLFNSLILNIKLKYYEFKTHTYLITYSIFFKNDYKQLIMSCPLNVTGKITWDKIEKIQKYIIEMHGESFQYGTVLGLQKIKYIKARK